jgi:hypothetical protein
VILEAQCENNVLIAITNNEVIFKDGDSSSADNLQAMGKSIGPVPPRALPIDLYEFYFPIAKDIDSFMIRALPARIL